MKTAFALLVTLLCATSVAADGPESRWVRIVLPKYTCRLATSNNQLPDATSLLLVLAVNAATDGSTESDIHTYCNEDKKLVVFTHITDLSANKSAELDRDAAALMEKELEALFTVGISLSSIDVFTAPEGSCAKENAVFTFLDTDRKVGDQCVAVKCAEGYEVSDNACVEKAEDSSSGGDDGIAKGAIIAIVVVILFAVCITAFVVYKCCIKKSAKQEEDVKEIRSEPISGNLPNNANAESEKSEKDAQV